MQKLVIKNSFIDAECVRLGVENFDATIDETYSQHQEDVILESLLRCHLPRTGRVEMQQLSYIEIGANHPIHHSATYLFHKKYGARGVLCEANPALCAALSRTRPGDILVNGTVSGRHDATSTLYLTKHHPLSSMDKDHIAKFSGDSADIVDAITVTNIHINDFMEKYGSSGVDLLCIDTEGLDFEIVTNLDLEKYHPAFIQCEPSGSLGPFIDYMKSKNYILIAMTDVNVIFAHAFAILGLVS